MDLSQLHVFLTVAKEQSFSRAAEKLFRTQPAVSIVIRKLEESVGQPLLVRGARQVKLTDAGELLRDYAERLLNLRDEIEKGMDDLKSLGRGGHPPRGERKLDPRALAGPRALQANSIRGEADHAPNAFARHPARKFLVTGSTSAPSPTLPPQDAKLGTRHEILQDELTFVVPPKHKLARRPSVDIKELGGETFIAHNVDSPYRSRVIQLFEKHHTPLNRDIEMPTIESIKRFVQMGMGVAIVPRMCVQWEVERKLLAEVRIRQLRLPALFCAWYRAEARVSRTPP